MLATHRIQTVIQTNTPKEKTNSTSVSAWKKNLPPEHVIKSHHIILQTEVLRKYTTTKKTVVPNWRQARKLKQYTKQTATTLYPPIPVPVRFRWRSHKSGNGTTKSVCVCVHRKSKNRFSSR